MLSLQGSSFPNNYDHHHPASAYDQQARPTRKRKADQQDNERLSKRLGRLNIGKLPLSYTMRPGFPHAHRAPPSPTSTPGEVQYGFESVSNVGGLAGQNLRKLYATVEDDTSASQASHALSHPPADSSYGTGSRASTSPDEHMEMDDSKHRVYIYNLDDELSSSESEAEEGKLIFLPDIEKALRANRIPPVVRANRDGQLAGHNLEDMQLVLYNVPSSLTVAPEHDSVRKAIVEARQRAREKQRRDSAVDMDSSPPTIAATTITTTADVDDDAMDLS